MTEMYEHSSLFVQQVYLHSMNNTAEVSLEYRSAPPPRPPAKGASHLQFGVSLKAPAQATDKPTYPSLMTGNEYTSTIRTFAGVWLLSPSSSFIAWPVAVAPGGVRGFGASTDEWKYP